MIAMFLVVLIILSGLAILCMPILVFGVLLKFILPEKRETHIHFDGMRIVK